MSISTMLSVLLVIFSVNISLCFVINGSGGGGGFSTKLYRRDFPGTPSYDPTLSLTDLISRAIDRSFAHYNSTTAIIPNSLKATVKYRNSDYMMKIALGTPPLEMFVAIDTSSDLTWTQCHPCHKCLRKHRPYFNPVKSSTYQTIKCIQNLTPCPNELKAHDCKNNVCTHIHRYNDGIKTYGVLSTDILTMESSTTGPPVMHTNYIFGCGFYNNEGSLSPEASGIIGFGHGSSRSFISQLDHSIQGKFSYCLVPNYIGPLRHSTINFGHNAIVSGPEAVSTPLIFKNDGHNFYFATLQALTIAGEIIKFTGEKGNIIIDSGTTLSKFPVHFHRTILAAFARHIDARRVKDPSMRFDLCYELDAFALPNVIANFVGADILLKFDNLFVRSVPGITCLAITELAEEAQEAVWGNLAQINYLIGFDIPAKTLSFKPVDCTTI